MTPAHLSQLFARDVVRWKDQIATFQDDASLWQLAPGITNSAGNLTLHLEGNLRDFIGNCLAGIPYERRRDLEFGGLTGLPKADLLARITSIEEWLPAAVAALTPQQLESEFPKQVWGRPINTGQFLIHLYGHLNYHLGQIGYLRRMLTGASAIHLAELQ
jgi:Protein of unknown function (DUF1572)